MMQFSVIGDGRRYLMNVDKTNLCLVISVEIRFKQKKSIQEILQRFGYSTSPIQLRIGEVFFCP
jgi:hypothetical protein